MSADRIQVLEDHVKLLRKALQASRDALLQADAIIPDKTGEDGWMRLICEDSFDFALKVSEKALKDTE